MPPAVRLVSITSTDAPWSRAGFSTPLHLSNFHIHFSPSPFPSSPCNLTSLGFSNLPKGILTIGGIPVHADDTPHGTAGPQPNTCVALDHVVVYTNDLDRIKKDFAGLGETPRIEVERMPGVKQVFFRPGGGAIIEVVVREGIEGTYLWGLTLVAEDLDEAKRMLGEAASKPKMAVQKGRRIMTLRHEQLGMKANVAMMTPHVKKDGVAAAKM